MMLVVTSEVAEGASAQLREGSTLPQEAGAVRPSPENCPLDVMCQWNLGPCLGSCA